MTNTYNQYHSKSKEGSYFLKENRQGSFVANVYFGSPANRCSGHGICKIVRLDIESVVPTEWNSCMTLTQVNHSSNGGFSIQVLKSSISKALYERQFSSAFFKVDTSFDMKPFFESARQQYIEKGHYLFWEDKNFIYVDFNKKYSSVQ